GTVREAGPTEAILSDPTDGYTRTLLADAPSLARVVERPKRPASESGPPLLTVAGLRQEFRGRGRATVVAVDDVSFTVARGTTHALVGESGSGKTTIGRSITGFNRPTAGTIRIGDADVTALRSHRAFRRRVQLIYQNPYASLDPRQTVSKIIAEPLLNFGIGDRADQVRRYLELVALPPDVADRRPHELSGGQRQRVAIARALIIEP